MALKSVLDSLDDVPEALKEHYKANEDGKFILQVEGSDSLPDVANLKNAYTRVKDDRDAIKTERDTLKTKVETFPSDFDQQKWDDAKAGKKVDDTALVELRKELEAERDTEKTRADQAEAKLSNFGTERDLDGALLEAGVTDAALVKGARAILAGSVKTSDEGKAYVDTDMGPVPLGEHVKRWAAGEGKAFVTPAKGGGQQGKDDNKTGSKKWSEMTSGEKTRLHQENPEEYKRVKEAA